MRRRFLRLLLSAVADGAVLMAFYCDGALFLIRGVRGTVVNLGFLFGIWRSWRPSGILVFLTILLNLREDSRKFKTAADIKPIVVDANPGLVETARSAFFLVSYEQRVGRTSRGR